MVLNRPVIKDALLLVTLSSFELCVVRMITAVLERDRKPLYFGEPALPGAASLIAFSGSKMTSVSVFEPELHQMDQNL